MTPRFGRWRSPRAAFRYLAEDAPSGYGDAADRLVLALRLFGVPLEYLGWSTMDSTDRTAHARAHSRDPLSSERARRGAPTVAHLVPEHLPNVRRALGNGPLISHTVWETDRLPGHWPALLNTVDRVVVPTEWNREVFVASGVTAPVAVVPHVVCDPVLGDLGRPLGLAHDMVVFYTIGRWDQRKVPSEVIRAYLEAFTADDPVALVVKTSPYAQYPTPDSWGRDSAISGTTMLEVARIVREFPSPAFVRVEVEDWDPAQIAGLHARGDCYVSLAHGEGWGFGAFDAAAYGNPVVMTGWGGQLDFLDGDSSFLVDYDLQAVQHWLPRSYGREQRWAVPHREHAVELLREVAGDIRAARRRAAPLRARVLDEFASSRVAATLLDVVPELDDAVEATARGRRGRARRSDDDLLLVGLVVGPWRTAYDNWVEMAERYGYRYEIVGGEVAEPYVPHATKWRVLLDYFADQPRDRVAFYLDVADGFVCDRPSIALERYRSYGTPLVFGAEANSTRKNRLDVPDPTWRYGNSGGFVGEAGVVADALRGGYGLADRERFGKVSDQHAMIEYLALPEHRHLATLDHRRVLVQNLARAPHYEEYDAHRTALNTRSKRSSTSSVHCYGDNGPGYNTFAALYGLKRVELQESGRFLTPSASSPRRAHVLTNEAIPRIAHFVFGLREEPETFHLVHYLAIMSCIEMVRPDEVYLHCHHLPRGQYWDLIEPLVRVERVQPVDAVRALVYADPSVARYSYAHHADFIRLDVLARHGGLYADIDTLFIAPIPDRLWRQPFVIGREADVVDPGSGDLRPALSNALLMSAPGSAFVEAWRAEIAGALDGTWANHSCFLAHDLAARLPHDVHVEPQRTFHAFDAVVGLSRLLEGNVAEVDGIVAIHLMAHLWWDDGRRDFSRVSAGMITEEWVRHAPVTYAHMARKFLPDR